MPGLCAEHDPVLVTGASGFVGACLVRRLLEMGYQVHVALRKTAKLWRLVDVLPRLHVHWVDLEDEASLNELLAQVRPRVVAHLAAYGAYESQADAEQILRTNILGTHFLLKAAQACGARLFLNTGSSSEYGFKQEPMRESDRLDPNSYYSVAKAAQTHLCQYEARRGKMAVVGFRLFSVFGPWEEPTRLFPTLIRRVRAGLPLQMANPATARDFVYVDDVLDALVDFSGMEKFSGEVFNLGSGQQTTLSHIVQVICRSLGNQVEVNWQAMPARHWDTNRWVADTSKTQANLSWMPKVSLEDAVDRMSHWMLGVGDDYGPRSLELASR